MSPRSVRYSSSANTDLERIAAFLGKETQSRAERAIDRLEHGLDAILLTRIWHGMENRPTT